MAGLELLVFAYSIVHYTPYSSTSNFFRAASLQTAILGQLDDNMARTVATLDKKHKAMLKDETSKGKEKLLRGVLGKL